MKKKIKVAVLSGGISNERGVSLKTAAQIAKALPKDKYQVSVLDIPKNENKALKVLAKKLDPKKIDVAFIALHGRFGEDGKIQGILDVLKIPYTGSGVLASALGMDKIQCSNILKNVGILIPEFLVLHNLQEMNIQARELEEIIGFPCVVKPNESGSSIGVTIVKDPMKLKRAVQEAFHEDKTVIVQKYIKGRELTCGVLGNNGRTELRALPVIEIIAHDAEFFDYQTKYFSNTVEEICPAKINQKIAQRVQTLSKKIHETLGCDGLTRSDFILSKDNRLYFLEINTIPGQTEASLCPKEARAAGIPFGQFLEMQIELALVK
jgi:D-alanine-D-alanine ligase